MLLSLVICITLFFVTAPYGRHRKKGWGPTVNHTPGWIAMEITSPLVFAYAFLHGGEKSTVNWIFFSVWTGHYFNRSIICPLRFHDKTKPMPLVICVSAAFFNIVNGFLNGTYLGSFQPAYEMSWLSDWRFIFGAALFISGFLINFTSDNILLSLRKHTAAGEYKIPEGGLFRWISCPNYLGEIIEWLGWALATWSLPGLSFAMWTAANLFPRAIAHHRWYKSRFEKYPPKRKAILPGIL